MKFVFILTIWSQTEPRPEAMFEAWGLTGDECITLMVEHAATDPTYERGIPSCEIDHGDEAEG